MDQVIEQNITPVVEGIFEDFNGIPFPQFFDQKEAFKRVTWVDNWAWYSKYWGSYIWYLAGFDRLKVLM